jgi:hypothetical protein
MIDFDFPALDVVIKCRSTNSQDLRNLYFLVVAI